MSELMARGTKNLQIGDIIIRPVPVFVVNQQIASATAFRTDGVRIYDEFSVMQSSPCFFVAPVAIPMLANASTLRYVAAGDAACFADRREDVTTNGTNFWRAAPAPIGIIRTVAMQTRSAEVRPCFHC